VIGSLGITAVLVAVGFLVYRSINALTDDEAWVHHTYKVIETLDETSSGLTEAESSQRGYLITGQPSYLEPYQKALPRIESYLAEIESLTTDNSKQQLRLTALRTAIHKRLATLKKALETRQQEGFEAAQSQVLTGEGRRAMDKVRALIDEMSGEEKRLLEQRSKQAHASARFALWVSCGGLGFSIFIALAILNLVQRETRRRMEVEAGLETANDKLQSTLSGMERLTREMTLIASTAEMLQTCRTSPEAHETIRRALLQLLPTASCSLGVRNASQNLIEVVSQTAEGQAANSQAVFAPDDCWALRRGRIHLTHDNAHDLRCPHLTTTDSTMCLPLTAQGETLGVLSVSAEAGTELSEADQRAAHAIGEHTALALANLNLQETLRTQSIRDPLSGLFNRRYLEVSFERELARVRRREGVLSVVMIDIDHFKNFNDTYGHEAGDVLIKEFGEFLLRHCRGEDIACRYGGEEFTLLLPEAPLEVAVQRAEQLRVGASELKIEFRRQPLNSITFSAGVAAYPIHGDNKDDVMRSADVALYQAKKAGRNRIEIAAPLEL
jgi:diguanylate cyclase (GGDEF)-like protein